MPQDAAIQCPFPSRASPDLDGARTRSLAWTRRYGLITGPETESTYRAWDIAALTAHWVPLARGPELDLAVAAVLWAAIFDDQFDGVLGTQPDQVEKICARFAAITRSDPTSPVPGSLLTSPLARAFADVRGRMTAGASPYRAERTNEHLRWFLGAYVDESKNRAFRGVPNREQYMELRRRSGFVYAMVDLIERSYGFELSRRTYELLPIQQMVDITADFVDTVNDVHSVEKEERWHDINNPVIVIEHERACSRAEAVTEIIALVSAWCQEFIDLETNLTRTCAEAGLADTETASAHRLAAGMRDAMGAYLSWSRTTPRYAQLVSGQRPPDKEV